MEEPEVTLDAAELATLQMLAAMWGMTPHDALKRALNQAAQPPVSPFGAPLENSTSSQAPVQYDVWQAD